jgi:hypothetical protein
VGVGETLGDLEEVMEGEPVRLLTLLTEEEGLVEELGLFNPELVVEALEDKEMDCVEVMQAVAVPKPVVLKLGLGVELGQAVMVEDTVMWEAVSEVVTLAEALMDGDIEGEEEEVRSGEKV